MKNLLPPREKNQELYAESQTRNNNAMDYNNNQLCDSIWKYAFKLIKMAIPNMHLDVFPTSIQVYVLIQRQIVTFNTT